MYLTIKVPIFYRMCREAKGNLGSLLPHAYDWDTAQLCSSFMTCMKKYESDTNISFYSVPVENYERIEHASLYGGGHHVP